MSPESALRRACERLRTTGARLTGPRLRVLAALLAVRHPASHHDLGARLAPIDKVTLYRVLEWLVARGIAHRTAGSDRVWRYAAGEAAHASHAHFECSSCAKVLCLGEVASPAKRLRLPRGCRLREIELTAKGLCAECA